MHNEQNYVGRPGVPGGIGISEIPGGLVYLALPFP